MKVLTVSEFHADLAGALDAVEDDAEDLVVVRDGREPVVVMRKSDYDAWREASA